MTRTQGRSLVLAAAVCFGTTGTAQATGLPGAPPAAVGAARILVGAAGLLLVALLAARARGARLTLPTGRAALVGAVAVAVYQPTFFLAVDRTGVAVGTVVALGSAPVVTGALSWATGHGRPGGRWTVATALAALGLTLLTAADGGRVDPLGVLLALAAGTGYATYALATQHLMAGGVAAESAMAAVFAGGALLLAPTLFVLDTDALVTPRGAATVLFLGLVTTTLAYVLFGRGLRVTGAAEAATLTLAEPLTAAALGVVLLGEGLGPVAATGAVLLLTGLAALAVPVPGRLAHRLPRRTSSTTQEPADPVVVAVAAAATPDGSRR